MMANANKKTIGITKTTNKLPDPITIKVPSVPIASNVAIPRTIKVMMGAARASDAKNTLPKLRPPIVCRSNLTR